MRISDWSSDVCSSDLGIRKGAQEVDRLEAMPTPKELAARSESWGPYRTYASLYLWRIADTAVKAATPTKRSDRKSVVAGKSVSVSVDLGGRRIIKKKKNTKA